MKKDVLKYLALAPLLSVIITILSLFVDFGKFYLIFPIILIITYFGVYLLGREYKNKLLKVSALIAIFWEAIRILLSLLIKLEYDDFYFTIGVMLVTLIIYILIGFGFFRSRKEIKLSLTAGILIILSTLFEVFDAISLKMIYFKTSLINPPILLELILDIFYYFSLFFWVCFGIILAIIFYRESKSDKDSK